MAYRLEQLEQRVGYTSGPPVHPPWRNAFSHSTVLRHFSQTLEDHIVSCPVKMFYNIRGYGIQEINEQETKKQSKPETGQKLSDYHSGSQEQLVL